MVRPTASILSAYSASLCTSHCMQSRILSGRSFHRRKDRGGGRRLRFLLNDPKRAPGYATTQRNCTTPFQTTSKTSTRQSFGVVLPEGNSKMQLPPYYRLWIYSINGLLILIQLVFLFCSYTAFSHPWIKYFPFGWSNLLVVLTYASIGIQLIVCVGGILGALLLSRKILRIYWLFMIPLLVFDLVKAICWVMQFRDMHRHYATFMMETTNTQIHSAESNATNMCSEWTSLQVAMECCAPDNILQFCNCTEGQWEDAVMSKYVTLCSNKQMFSCANPLLRWFHRQTDLLAIIAYYILFPLKLIVVVVLRKDIQELFGEIVYAGNRHLYRHWAVVEPVDEINNNLSGSLQFDMDTVTSYREIMVPRRAFQT